MAKTNGRDTTNAKTLEKVASLVKLANDDPDSEESRNAAVQATRLMKEHELVLVPKSEIERVQQLVEGANELARRHATEKNTDRFIGAAVGFLLAKQLKLSL